jgi:hypothetical protein
LNNPLKYIDPSGHDEICNPYLLPYWMISQMTPNDLKRMRENYDASLTNDFRYGYRRSGTTFYIPGEGGSTYIINMADSDEYDDINREIGQTGFSSIDTIGDITNLIIDITRSDEKAVALDLASLFFFGNIRFLKYGDDIIDSWGSIRFSGGTASTKNISNLTVDIKEWIGDGGRVIHNSSGDTILLSTDGTRRVRFDINNPSPHDYPHGHVEEFVNGKWVKSGPIYPKDVP